MVNPDILCHKILTSNADRFDRESILKEEFVVLHELVEAAKKNLDPGAFGYLMGAAESETTFLKNRIGFDSLALVPRVLVDVSEIDMSTQLFGIPLRLPVMLAPIGSIEDLATEGGIAPTRAAADFGIVHMLSSVAKPGKEAVAKSADYPKFFQLYVRGDADWVDDRLSEALDLGYAGLCLTVDRAYYGRRERDLVARHKPTQRAAPKGEIHQAQITWKDVDRIRHKFNTPLMLKGIGCSEDARLAVEHGIDGVYISNHGGRQLDHGPGTIEILPEIVETVGGRAKIILDGGVLRGTDVIKALALGCDVVAIGRLQGIALGAAGQQGVVRMLEILENEIQTSLGLLGVASIKDLGPEYVRATEPFPGRTGYRSAFPLIGPLFSSDT